MSARTWDTYPGLAHGHTVSNVTNNIGINLYSALNRGYNRIELLTTASRMQRRILERNGTKHRDTWRKHNTSYRGLTRRQYSRLRRQIGELQHTLDHIRHNSPEFSVEPLQDALERLRGWLPVSPRYDGKIDYPDPLAIYAACSVTNKYRQDQIEGPIGSKGFGCDHTWRTTKTVAKTPWYTNGGQDFARLDRIQAEALMERERNLYAFQVREMEEIPF